jgi:hypothetical protein
MTEYVKFSITIPVEVDGRLDKEAIANRRSKNKQIQVIFEERYGLLPATEEKGKEEAA